MLHIPEHLRNQLDAIGQSIEEHKVDYLQNPEVEAIDFELWEVLAYDIALKNPPIEQLASAYNVAIPQIATLQEHDAFKRILALKRQEVAQIGSNADFTVMMRMIANKGAKRLLERLMNHGTSDRDFATLYKQVIQLAKLEPIESKADGDSVPNAFAGNSVVFNLYGIPGLEHLQNPNLPTTIDVTPAQPIRKPVTLSDDDELEAL